mgnify:CR=1 FL=1
MLQYYSDTPLFFSKKNRAEVPDETATNSKNTENKGNATNDFEKNKTNNVIVFK